MSIQYILDITSDAMFILCSVIAVVILFRIMKYLHQILNELKKGGI